MMLIIITWCIITDPTSRHGGIIMPRTTLTLEDEVLAILKRYASSRSMSLGEAVGELVRRGLHGGRPVREVNGLVVVDLPADSPIVRHEDVEQLESEEP
jgi:hypothetical protein